MKCQVMEIQVSCYHLISTSTTLQINNNIISLKRKCLNIGGVIHSIEKTIIVKVDKVNIIKSFILFVFKLVPSV